MLPDVVLGQRLFDEQQVERVEPGQGPGVGQRVGGVGVDLERDQSTEMFPDRLDRGDVPAGFGRPSRV